MVETKTLDNGLRIILQKMEGAKTATCFIGVKAGSIYEKPNNFGISHLLEHVLFCGSKKRNGEKLKEEFSKISTIFNGSTASTYTRFYVKNIKEYFEKSFELIADAVSNPKFDLDQIEKEKKVVSDEILRYDDMNSEVLKNAMYQAYYAEDRLKQLPLGDREIVKKITKQQLIDYYSEHYVPNNIVISFAGDLEMDEVVKFTLKYFSIAKQKSNLKSTVYNFVKSDYIPQKQNISIKKNVAQSTVRIMMPAPNCKDNDYYAFVVLSSILGGNTSSRLYKTIRDRLGYVYSINTYTNNDYHSGIFIIQFATAPQNVENALAEIKKILVDIKTNGITKQELSSEKLKNKIAITTQSEQTISVAGSNNLDMLQENRVYTDEDNIKLLEKVTAAEIHDVAKKVLSSEHMVCGILSDSLTETVFEKFVF